MGSSGSAEEPPSVAISVVSETVAMLPPLSLSRQRHPDRLELGGESSELRRQVRGSRRFPRNSARAAPIQGLGETRRSSGLTRAPLVRGQTPPQGAPAYESAGASRLLLDEDAVLVSRYGLFSSCA